MVAKHVEFRPKIRNLPRFRREKKRAPPLITLSD